jgi:hypothetical protein
VLCGENISFSSQVTGQYVAVQSEGTEFEVYPADKGRGAFEWTVICRSPPNWVRDEEVQFQNTKYGCLLSTSLELRYKEGINLYNVTCAGLTEAAVWRAVEGVYFNRPEPTEAPAPDRPSEDL